MIQTFRITGNKFYRIYSFLSWKSCTLFHVKKDLPAIQKEAIWSRWKKYFQFFCSLYTKLSSIFKKIFGILMASYIVVLEKRLFTKRHCRKVSTTQLRQWGFRQCLPFSWTTLRGKHCRHPIVVMGVVDTFGPHCLP